MKKRISTALLPLLALAFVLFSAGCRQDSTDSAYRSITDSETRAEEKMYWTGTIDQDFDGSSIIVIMDKYAGGINKEHKESFFGDFEKVSVTDLTKLTEYGISVTDKEIFRQTLEIKLPDDSSKKNVIRAIRELEKIKGILYAGPNFFYYPGRIPDDPDLINQWGLTGTAGIRAPAAWDITVCSSSVKVGIIDTGIANHPDLDANLLPGKNFVNPYSSATDTATATEPMSPGLWARLETIM